MRHVTGFLQHLSLLVVRIGFGLLLLTHAWHRYHQMGMGKEAAYLSAHHIAQPTLLAWGALALETVGGVLLVFGLAVPLVGLLLVVQNLVTIWLLKMPHGVFGFNRGFELNLVQALLALMLTFYGSGRAGLDALMLSRRRRSRQDPERLEVRDIP